MQTRTLYTHKGINTAAVRGGRTLGSAGNFTREVEGVPSIKGMGSPWNPAMRRWTSSRLAASKTGPSCGDGVVPAAVAACPRLPAAAFVVVVMRRPLPVLQLILLPARREGASRKGARLLAAADTPTGPMGAACMCDDAVPAVAAPSSSSSHRGKRTRGNDRGGMVSCWVYDVVLVDARFVGDRLCERPDGRGARPVLWNWSEIKLSRSIEI